MEISFYEIYNEKIFDLLSFNDGNKQRLCVREHPDMGPYVQGLSKYGFFWDYSFQMSYSQLFNKTLLRNVELKHYPKLSTLS